MEVAQESFQDVDQISEKDYPSNVIKCINSIIKRCHFQTYTISIKIISTGGGNYLGKLYHIDVNGKNGDGAKEIRAFMKSIIPCPETAFSVLEAYKTEVLFYKDISKIFAKLQDDANIPLEERYRFFESFEETNCETIVLENAAVKGYNTLERLNVASLDTAEICIKLLAKFHALSFAMEKMMPEYFEEKIKPRKQPHIFNEEYKTILKHFIQTSIKHLDGKSRERAETVLVNLNEFISLQCDSSSVRCLCHGDFRLGNILFKQKDGVIQDAIPVDYQLLSYMSPITDFLFFTVICTSQEFRKKHLEHLKDLYYKTLTNFLEYFKFDSGVIYPKSQFEEDYRNKIRYGLFIALQFLPFVLVDESDVPSLDVDLKTMSFAVHGCCAERLQGVVNDYIEWGYL